jgi:hypothetical protein
VAEYTVEYTELTNRLRELLRVRGAYRAVHTPTPDEDEEITVIRRRLAAIEQERSTHDGTT